MSVCHTCVHNGNGSVLREADARIHKDNFPDHNIQDVNTITEEENGFIPKDN